MAHSAIMSVRITGNADDAVKAFEKTTTKAAAFGSAIGGLAVKGVTALWDTVKGFAGDVVNMSDSTDKFMNTMSFAGIDTKAVQAAAKETRKYADATVYGLDDIQNTTAQLAANGIGNYMERSRRKPQRRRRRQRRQFQKRRDDAHADRRRGKIDHRELEPARRRHPGRVR